jgi:hypothetical protein
MVLSLLQSLPYRLSVQGSYYLNPSLLQSWHDRFDSRARFNQFSPISWPRQFSCVIVVDSVSNWPLSPRSQHDATCIRCSTSCLLASSGNSSLNNSDRSYSGNNRMWLLRFIITSLFSNRVQVPSPKILTAPAKPRAQYDTTRYDKILSSYTAHPHSLFTECIF